MNKINSRLVLLSTYFFIAMGLFASASAKDHSKTVLATVGTEQITYQMLEKAYNKNLGKDQARFSDINRAKFDTFLKRYIDYRLKVLDAIDKGYDKDKEVMADIEKNKNLLAESFFFENSLLRPNVEKMLERRGYELRFSFIILSTKPDSASTMSAMEKATMILDKIKNGEDFKELAKKYSIDKGTGRNGGEMNKFITSGKIQRPIEEVLYKLKPGEVYSEIIETKYGLFIIKLDSKFDRVFVDASHILLGLLKSFSEETEDSDKRSTDAIADSVLALLKNGASFEQLAKELSEDEGSAISGGGLGGFYSRSTGFEGNGRPLDQKFETAMFNLKDGEISGKIESSYGIHIIKRNASRGFDKKAEEKKIKSMYKKSFYDKDKKELMARLAIKHGFEINQDNMTDFQTALDTLLRNLDPKWASRVPKNLNDKTLFSFNNKDWSIGEFINIANTKNEFKGINLDDQGIADAAQKMIYGELIKKVTANLENEDSKFADLVKEFRDGIILFKVEDEEVWQKRKFDSTVAKAYYDSTKSNYYSNVMYDLVEVHLLESKEASELYKSVQAGEPFDVIAAIKTQRPNYREKKGEWGWVDSETHFLGKTISNDDAVKGKVYKPKAVDKGYSILKIRDIRPAKQKTYQEALPQLTPKVQDILQENIRTKWLERVAKKHKIEIKTSRINKIVKSN